MKLKVKNLKGEVFEVEVEAEDTVFNLLVRSQPSRIKSRKPRGCLLRLSRWFSRAKLSITKTQSRRLESRIPILLSA